MSCCCLLATLFVKPSMSRAQSATTPAGDATSAPVEVDLSERYPTALTAGTTDPQAACEWTFTEADIYEVSRFSFRVGELLRVETDCADVGIGHCSAGAVWAVVRPRDAGRLKSSAARDVEPVGHIWLRFHPREIAALFPAATVLGPGQAGAADEMRRIARLKMRGSWHAGERAMIPEPKDFTLDADTVAGPRRFFGVDRAAGAAKYVSAFESRSLPAPQRMEPNSLGSGFDDLWQQFDREYPMFVLRPDVSWEKLRDELRPRAIASGNSYEFAQACAAMLRPLRDLHISITVNGEPVEVFNRPRETNANCNAFESLLGPLANLGRHVQWAKTIDPIGYLAIHHWSDEAIPAQVDEILENLRDTRGLILDVRLNGGGNEALAREVAGRFADKEYVYAFSRFRSGPRHEDLTERAPRSFAARGPWRYDCPVIVLIGQRCMSSNESFVSMMGECPQVTLMGDRTCGSSGNPRMLEYPGGLTVTLPRWIDYLPDGTPLDERGVQPDIRLTPPPDAFREKRDDLLAAALDRLRQAPSTPAVE